MEYTAEELVRPARRDGNTIRPYLFVNPLQGKHIPAEPAGIAGMCAALAAKAEEAWPGDRLYVIGFAETATGIAAAVTASLRNAAGYQHTTREHAEGVECLHFTEAHSHATDQILRTEGLREGLRAADRVVLIDDEVTTGKTILNLIRLLREGYGAEGKKFGIVSVLNSMTEERTEALRREGVECLYLAKIPHEYRKESILGIPFEEGRHTVARAAGKPAGTEAVFTGGTDPRYTVSFRAYAEETDAFAAAAVQAAFPGGAKRGSVLVLGTEEFMYPALITGERILREGLAEEVRVHATTRSPIVAAGAEGYPLTRRWQIRSAYDPERTTYVYNLKKYDLALVVTDAPPGGAGLADIREALEGAGTREIVTVRREYGEGKERKA